MGSKPWKELESYVAGRLGGIKPIRRSYSDSQPDVVVPAFVLEDGCSPSVLSIIVECKYSVYQPWQRMAHSLINKFGKYNNVCILTCDNLVLWNLEDTKSILSAIHIKKADPVNLISNYSIIPLSKKVPKYIRRALGQAASYSDWIQLREGLWIPTLCLGQRGAHKRIMVAEILELKGLKLNAGRHQASSTSSAENYKGKG